MKKIKLFDLKNENYLENYFLKSFKRLLREKNYVKGSPILDFEKKFARYNESKYAISCNSGTDALYIILKALGVDNKSEVITTSLSWISSASSISHTGAKPIFIDTSKDFNIDVKKIEKSITKKTKALLIVHLYGLPCDMDEILSICKKNKIHLIEDCAQSHFSKYKGKNVGNFGIASAFSFFPTKTLGAFGDAGCIITNNETIEKKARLIANNGKKNNREFINQGINSRMDTLQALILSKKLDNTHQEIIKKRRNVLIYKNELKKTKFLSHIEIPNHKLSTFYVFTIRIKKFRNELRSWLLKNNIETGIYYDFVLPHTKLYLKTNYKTKNFKQSKINSVETLSLPIHHNLTRKEIKYICKKINIFFEKINNF